MAMRRSERIDFLKKQKYHSRSKVKKSKDKKRVDGNYAILNNADSLGGKISVLLKKSTIGVHPKHRKTIAALGLGRVNSLVEHQLNAAMRGMLLSVVHLISVTKKETV